MVIWLVGLSGSGKTTLGEAVARHWRTRSPETVLVDGDVVRRLFRHDLDESAYTIEGRRVNAERIVEICAWLDLQRFNVVCCTLSFFPDLVAANRSRFSRYYEVFLDAPLDVLVDRDRKGLYAAAIAGHRRNVVGVDIAFQAPATADLVINTAGPLPDIEQLAARVLGTALGEAMAQ